MKHIPRTLRLNSAALSTSAFFPPEQDLRWIGILTDDWWVSEIVSHSSAALLIDA
jgi:hypothetical protein